MAVRGGTKDNRGPKNPGWTGGRIVNKYGYVDLFAPDHPRARGCYVYEHILVAERALGRHLTAPHHVHHVNGDKADNRPGNLVICEDNAYHMLLHQRARAMARCGNPNWRLCRFCGLHDDPVNLFISKNGYADHVACNREYQRRWRAARRAAQSQLQS